MKKLVLSLAVVAFLAGTVSTSYGQVPDKQSVKGQRKPEGREKRCGSSKTGSKGSPEGFCIRISKTYQGIRC
jgi:predicted porin